jgi:hypothetical protein
MLTRYTGESHEDYHRFRHPREPGGTGCRSGRLRRILAPGDLVNRGPEPAQAIKFLAKASVILRGIVTTPPGRAKIPGAQRHFVKWRNALWRRRMCWLSGRNGGLVQQRFPHLPFRIHNSLRSQTSAPPPESLHGHGHVGLAGHPTDGDRNRHGAAGRH